ncbi:uncharacterized protein METZ01_LOCUS73660, partial [marine metagenome]
LIALAPLVLLGVLLVVIIQTWPGNAIGVSQHPPVEKLSFSAAKLRPNEISLTVFNDGPDTVTISQIQVDDAYWAFTSDAGTILSHLQSARLTIPYPWVEG